MIRRTTFCDSPARGGSTISTSGRPARSTSSRSASRTSPAKKCALSISLARALAIASAIASSTSSRPHTSATRGRRQQTDRPDPAVQVVERARSRSGAAYSIASSYSRSAISVLVWKNASAEIRKRIPPSCSSKRSAPASSSVSPPWVVSADAVVPRPQQAVEALAGGGDSDSRSSSPVGGDQPHLELRRCGGPRARRGCAAGPRRCGGRRRPAPARGTRRRSARGPRCRRSEASRQSVIGDDLVPAAGRVEAAHQRAAGRRCRTSTRACCGSATAATRGHDRLELEAVELADPAQRVVDLLLLDLELALVGRAPARARRDGRRPARSGRGRASRISTARASA